MSEENIKKIFIRGTKRLNDGNTTYLKIFRNGRWSDFLEYCALIDPNTGYVNGHYAVFGPNGEILDSGKAFNDISRSAYTAAVSAGYTGTEEEFNTSMSSIANKADANGNYPSLTAGAASRLLAPDSDDVVDDGASFIFRSTAGDVSVSDGDAAISKIKGALSVVNGALTPFNPSGLKSVCFNAINPSTDKILTGYKLNSSGAVVADAGYALIWFKCLLGQSGSGNNNGYVIKLKNDSAGTLGLVGASTSEPTSSSTGITIITASTHFNSTSYLPSAAGWIIVSVTKDHIDDLCASLAWSGKRDTEWAEYKESVRVVDKPHVWGFAKLGNVYDEADFSTGKLYARCDRINLGEIDDWELVSESATVDGESITIKRFVSDAVATLVKKPLASITANILCDAYTAAPYNTVHDNLTDDRIAIDTLGNICVYDSTHSTAAAFATAMAGKYLYYEKASVAESATTGATNYEMSDHGTEEWLGVSIAPSSSTHSYKPNLTDDLRNMRSFFSALERTVAEALAEQDKRIAAIEKCIANGNFKDITVEKLSVLKDFSIFGETNLVKKVTAVPSEVADFVGQRFIDTTNNNTYTAVGNSAVNQIKQENNS